MKTKAAAAPEGADWTRFYADQAALDAEFTLNSIPDLEFVRARRASAAEQGLAEFPPLGPLRYGADPDETLVRVGWPSEESRG